MVVFTDPLDVYYCRIDLLQWTLNKKYNSYCRKITNERVNLIYDDWWALENVLKINWKYFWDILWLLDFITKNFVYPLLPFLNILIPHLNLKLINTQNCEIFQNVNVDLDVFLGDNFGSVSNKVEPCSNCKTSWIDGGITVVLRSI